MKTLFFVPVVLVAMLAGTAYATEPYYGFYPSSKGLLYKLFRHNIFNFEMDLPQNWAFGIIGKMPLAEIMMYPEGLNTGKLTPSYETISVGIMPYRKEDIGLTEVYEFTIAGYRQIHSNHKIIKRRERIKVNGNDAIRFIFVWLSKTGYEVKEEIYIVAYEERYYSIAVRTVEPISDAQRKVHRDIVNTFTPIKPVYGKRLPSGSTAPAALDGNGRALSREYFEKYVMSFRREE